MVINVVKEDLQECSELVTAGALEIKYFIFYSCGKLNTDP